MSIPSNSPDGSPAKVSRPVNKSTTVVSSNDARKNQSEMVMIGVGRIARMVTVAAPAQ
jgi:hypothetical protein